MFIITCTGRTNTEERNRKMILAGTDVIRINLCRRAAVENKRVIQSTQEVISFLHSNVKILLDIPLNRLLLGDFDTKVFSVRENEEYICKSGPYSPDCNQFIPVQIKKLGERVQPEEVIIAGEGETAMQVAEVIDSETIKVRMLNNGILRYMSHITIKNHITPNEFLEKFKVILSGLMEFEFDYISFPYINQIINDEIKKLPFFARNDRHQPKICVKIENDEAVKNVDAIIDDPFYKYILVSRGELGINLPYHQLGLLQKEIIQKAKKRNKPVIIATQILESTAKNYLPSRADILDVTNMVLDGAAGIQFGMEAGVLGRPSYTISTAKKIIETAKKYKRQTEG